jgi:hypothetical protein
MVVGSEINFRKEFLYTSDIEITLISMLILQKLSLEPTVDQWMVFIHLNGEDLWVMQA